MTTIPEHPSRHRFPKSGKRKRAVTSTPDPSPHDHSQQNSATEPHPPPPRPCENHTAHQEPDTELIAAQEDFLSLEKPGATEFAEPSAWPHEDPTPREQAARDFFAPPAQPREVTRPGRRPHADHHPEPSHDDYHPERHPIVDRDVPEGRELLASRRRPVTGRGWRRLVSKMTGGKINPRPSAKQRHEAQTIENIRRQFVGVHKVAFVSSKGGVGKSTMTVTVGNAIARLRGDRVIAVDVDADLGDLSSRFGEAGGPDANIEQLAMLEDTERYSSVREYTVVNGDRLEMLASQNDPRSTYRLTPEDFATTMRILDIHCNLILLDCGTPVNGPLFSEIVSEVDGLVVVASQDVRGVEGALATLDWLHAHGFDAVLDKTIVALNALHGRKPLIDRKAVENQFRKRVSDVYQVPYDRHLATGLTVEFSSLKPTTQKAILELAGGVAQHYPPKHVRKRRDELGEWIDAIRHH